MFFYLSYSIIAWCLFIFLYDFFSRRIPNQLLVIALITYALFLFYWGYGFEGTTWPKASLGLIIGCVVLLPFYFFKIIGAGDVKCFATIGFLFGWHALLPIGLLAAVLTGIHALIVIFIRHALDIQPFLASTVLRVKKNTFYQRITNIFNGQKGVPFAGYLALSAIYRVLN